MAEKASREVISLPMHPFLSETEQDKVVAELEIAVQEEHLVGTELSTQTATS